MKGISAHSLGWASPVNISARSFSWASLVNISARSLGWAVIVNLLARLGSPGLTWEKFNLCMWGIFQFAFRPVKLPNVT